MTRGSDGPENAFLMPTPSLADGDDTIRRTRHKLTEGPNDQYDLDQCAVYAEAEFRRSLGLSDHGAEEPAAIRLAVLSTDGRYPIPNMSRRDPASASRSIPAVERLGGFGRDLHLPFPPLPALARKAL